MNNIFYRNEDTEQLIYRKIFVNQTDGSPKTYDKEKRSVEVIATTENPALIYDWERGGSINEILLMSGAEMPENGQLPLLDSHNRWGTDDVIGSLRNIHIKSKQMLGTAYFSSLAEDISTKVEEGHLTDFSVGYRVKESSWIPKNEIQTIEGKKYKGPLKVTTKWEPLELSVVPIGADKKAKARSEQQKIDTRATVETNKKEKEMDPKLLEFLLSKGLPKDATEEEAYKFLATLDVRKAETTPVDEKEPDAQRSANEDEIMREVSKRNAEIMGMCRKFEVPDEVTQRMISEGSTIEQAREYILQDIEKRSVKIHTSPAVIIDDCQDKFKRAGEDAIMIRAGFAPEKVDRGARDMTGFSLVEIARQALKVKNLNYSGHAKDVVGRALMTTDFPYLLANVANKSLFAGFDNAPETWRIWCNTGSVSDFKTNYLPRLSEADTLDLNPEGMPADYGTLTEAQESYSVATYRKLYAITRQMLINDDLGAMTSVPMRMGEASARTVGNIAYAVLTANANMGDGNALFVSGHGNLASGGDLGLPGVATMNEMERKMMVQTDEKGLQRLNIPLVYMIGPAAIKGATESFFRSEYRSDPSTIATDSSMASTQANIWAGDRVTRVYDARLDDTSTTGWYGAGPKGKTVTVFFLGGKETPTMETEKGWTVQGTEFSVYIDCGAKAVSWKALQSNPGA